MRSIIRVNRNFETCMIEELKQDTTTEWLEWSDNYSGIFDDFRKKYVSFWEVQKLYASGEIDRVVVTPYYIAENVIEEIEALGIPRNKIFVYEGKEDGVNTYTNIDDFVMLPYLEFHAADHCNLNCKGCATFSPLVKKEVFPNFEKYKKDIVRIKELIPFIRTIHIMGGEPTLNPDLGLFVREARRVYPYSRIRIVTNGTLIDRLDEKVWKDILDNDVTFYISCYPAVYNGMDKILATIREHGAKEPVINQVSVFYPSFTEKKKYPFDNTEYCRCYNIRDGKIASCPVSMYGHYYNDFFDGHIPFASGVLDIYEKSLTGKRLVELLNTPCDICNYCQNYIWRLNSKYVKEKQWDYYKNDEKPVEEDWY